MKKKGLTFQQSKLLPADQVQYTLPVMTPLATTQCLTLNPAMEDSCDCRR